MKHTKFFKHPASIATLACTLLLTTQSGFASPFKMSVFDDYESSIAVLKGDYDKAIELATLGLDTKSKYKRVVEATTLCVAYTKTGKYTAAESACDKAVENSEKVMRNKENGKIYSDGISRHVSLVEVAEINQKALSSLLASK